MAQETIYTGQNVTKDCVVGDRLLNRYCIFNGLERPRRIDSNGTVTILGVGQAPAPTALVPAGGGAMAANWYSYQAVYASATYTRPVAVLDGSGNYTRGNPSPYLSTQVVGPDNAVQVTIPSSVQAGITHVLLYRSLGAATQAVAEAGPFYYVGQVVNVGATVTVLDTVADALVGLAVEADNFPPNAYRYAVLAYGFVFTGGNFPIGPGYTCEVTPGSSTVTANADIFYDGIIGWNFKLTSDTSGGVNEAGLYYANYVDSRTLQLVDADGNAANYDGASSGSGYGFTVYLAGNALRWSKYGEPEASPTGNLILFGGDITGLAQFPNQSLLLVCTDEPSMYVLDLNLVGTDSFKVNKRIISTIHTASSHYSIIPVEGKLRAIDAHERCIIEMDGTVAHNISSGTVLNVFKYLSTDINDIKLWHCAYDPIQHLFGAMVTFRGAQRFIDFCIGQFTLTRGWFFNFEKDLLCTGMYVDPATGETMILGGTEGPGTDVGGVWGRIWSPNIYSEWIPSSSVLSGTIDSVADANNFTIDTSGGTMYTVAGGLAGRWVLVCDENGEYAQVGYIISNTASSIRVNAVINGMDYTQFSPIPEEGWKFYLGLIECRWGPKQFDFDDPDTLKKVWEVWCCVSGHDESDPPFTRLYRGFERSYASQLTLQERIYLDRTETQSLVNKVDNKLEAVPRWGVAWYDRSHGPTILHSLSIVFNLLGGKR